MLLWVLAGFLHAGAEPLSPMAITTLKPGEYARAGQNSGPGALPSSFAPAPSLHFGNVGDPVWMRFWLEAPQKGRWWLYTPLRTPEFMRLYVDHKDLGSHGTGYEFSTRPALSLPLAIPLDLDSGTHELLVWAFDPQGDCLLEASLVPDSLLPAKLQTHALLSGLVCGMLLLVWLLSLYLWSIVRRPAFAWYAGYVGFGLLWVTTKTGLGAAWLWPGTPSLNLVTPTLFNHLALGCFWLFLRGMLEMPRHLPWGGWWMLIAALYEFAASLLGPLAVLNPGWHRWLLRVSEPEALQLPLMGVSLLLLLWRVYKKDSLALRLALASSPLAGVAFAASWLELGSHASASATNDWLTIAGALLENTLTTWALVYEVRRREKARQELEKDFHIRLLEKTDAQRELMARELHDDLGQRLVALRLSLSQEGALEPKERAQAAQELGSLVADLRDFTHSLHPRTLGQESLGEALGDLCMKTARQTGLPIEFQAADVLPCLKPEQSQHLYRIAQEALQNAIRHAKPSRIGMRLACRSGRLTLCIEDDGCGMDTERENSGIGLSHMQARAHALGSALKLRSVKNKGTLVEIKVRL